MDGKPLPVSPSDLYAHLGTASAPVVVDVRAAASFADHDRLIIGALRQPPGDVERWREGLPPGRSVVVYCGDGNKPSRDAASTLRNAGIKAGDLEGGFVGWLEKRLPTRRNLGSVSDKWVTREHPKIDRIACPWLVRRFIDPSAQFIYVPPTEVLSVAKETGATS